MTTATEPAETGTEGYEIRRGHRIAAGIIALGLVVVSIWLPLWRTHLTAPQYPGGLHVYAYGWGMDGDIREVDGLNHYIGMKAFNTEDVPEMALYPLGIATAIAAVVVALFVRKRLPNLIAHLYVWAFPLTILVAIQYHLWEYGHDLNPHAALRVPEFTPWVMGPTKVWNFTNTAYPGRGLLLLIASAVVVTFGPRVFAYVEGELRLYFASDEDEPGDDEER